MIPEYDDTDPNTWYAIPQPSVDPTLLRRLEGIGGFNAYGKPNLELRWGVTYRDPMSVADEPKYLYVVKEPVLIGFEFTEDGQTRFVKKLEEVPSHVLISVPKYNDVRLGERRWIVEQYRSPEFLKASGRYQFTHDTGDAEIRICCKNCGGGMRPTGREDERVCISCGSKRQSIVEFNDIKNERLLKDFPEEGCYDFFMRLETPDGRGRPFDGFALIDIEREWHRRQRPAGERQREVAEGRKRMAAHVRQARREIWHPDNLLTKEVHT